MKTIIRTPISLDDPTYFCNKSWTLSYNMITQSWVSFHSYIPNFYIAENNFFYSGKNKCDNDIDFIAATLTTTPDCTLAGTVTIVPLTTTSSTTINPDCALEATINVVDTTTTTSSTSTSTTSTTSTSSSTTSTSTTACARPSGLTQTPFFAAWYTPATGYHVISEGTVEEACAEFGVFKETTFEESGSTGYFNGEFTSLEIGQTIWNDYDETNCTTISDGNYWVNQTLDIHPLFADVWGLNCVYIVTVMSGIITAISEPCCVDCEMEATIEIVTTTTTTTIALTTTTTSTSTTTTTTTTIAPTTTSTTTTVVPTTTTTTTLPVTTTTTTTAGSTTTTTTGIPTTTTTSTTEEPPITTSTTSTTGIPTTTTTTTAGITTTTTTAIPTTTTTTTGVATTTTTTTLSATVTINWSCAEMSCPMGVFQIQVNDGAPTVSTMDNDSGSFVVNNGDKITTTVNTGGCNQAKIVIDGITTYYSATGTSESVIRDEYPTTDLTVYGETYVVATTTTTSTTATPTTTTTTTGVATTTTTTTEALIPVNLYHNYISETENNYTVTYIVTVDEPVTGDTTFVVTHTTTNNSGYTNSNIIILTGDTSALITRTYLKEIIDYVADAYFDTIPAGYIEDIGTTDFTVPATLDFDLTYNCTTGIYSEITMENYTGGSGVYELNPVVLFSSEAAALANTNWDEGIDPYSYFPMTNGTYWAVLRDAGNTSNRVAREVVVFCTTTTTTTVAPTTTTTTTDTPTTTTTTTFDGTTTTTTSTTGVPTTTTTSTTSTSTTTTTTTMHIGQEYGGGKIAYIFQPEDSCYVGGEVHGIICSTADQSNGSPWKISGTSTNLGTLFAICEGFDNTNLIITNQGGGIYGGYAAYECWAYNGNGYFDWFLGSFYEMSLVYDVKDLIGGFSVTGGMSGSVYATSSEDIPNPVTTVACLDFSDGNVIGVYKTNPIPNVRAIRYF